ncbi:hypothetical protein GCM10023080_022420 [Streptomyces pseudoechinosporeus]
MILRGTFTRLEPRFSRSQHSVGCPTTRSAWIDHTGELPVIEGTLIRLQVDHLPGGGDPLPVWL